VAICYFEDILPAFEIGQEKWWLAILGVHGKNQFQGVQHGQQWLL